MSEKLLNDVNAMTLLFSVQMFIHLLLRLSAIVMTYGMRYM